MQRHCQKGDWEVAKVSGVLTQKTSQYELVGKLYILQAASLQSADFTSCSMCMLHHHSSCIPSTAYATHVTYAITRCSVVLLVNCVWTTPDACVLPVCLDSQALSHVSVTCLAIHKLAHRTAAIQAEIG